MGVPVSITPSLIVPVVFIFRSEVIYSFLQIIDRAMFIFDSRYRRG